METENATRGSNTKDFYVIITDGNGSKERVINFDNEEICPKQGLIEVIPLKERKGFENNVKFRRVKDRATQCWIGIPEGINDDTKKITYQLITVIGRRIYDLSNEKDRKEWICIKYSPYLQGSPNQDRNGAPLFKVYDKEKQAVENLQKTRLKRKAAVIADVLEGEDLNDMLRACGIGVAGLSEIMKLNAITQFADENPDIFLKHWESPLRQEAFILKQAIEFDLIQVDNNIGLIYRTLSLGLTEQEAVIYLKEHPNVSTAIQTLVMQKKEETQKSNSTVEKSVNTGNDALDAANKEIEELKAALKKQANKSIEEVTGKSLDGDVEDPELETLRAIAKEKGIKGWHLTKDKDKLQALIDAKN